MKQMLNKLAISFIFAGVAGTASAGTALVALPSLGEDAGIHGLLNASVAYNDNIYLSETDEDADTIFTISPGLELSTGDESRSKMSLRFV
ncbi:MAG: hypothetical protein IJW12_01565 [Opitutales bacterium]|nr:hypothetical protein [Opitutales bacterium]